MTEETLIAGFGGQGVLSMGMLLAYGGMIEGQEVSWMPSYGPEMRGGTANCIVINGDEPISSPIVSRFDTVVIFNQPSLEKFETAVKPGGLLLYEEEAILTPPTRTDITVIAVPAARAAVELKNQKVINLVMLGALLAAKAIIKPATAVKALYKVLPERHHKLIPLNEQALAKGRELVVAEIPVS
ncbi:MAG: 2-oxoacid:acceptor oxidoreductase family protein [Candidatus Neomarinimicrobiota bacterium]